MDDAKPAGQKPKWWSRPRRADGPPPASPARPAEGAPAAAVPPERPLHGEDPYGTPPYGGPGPWAPAPPVQRPMATPAQGTVLPQPQPAPGQLTPAQGTPVPGTPAGGTHLPGPAAAVRGGAYDPWAMPAPGAMPSSAPPSAVPARRGPLLVAVVLLALVVGGIGGAVGSYVERNGVGEVELPQASAESSEPAPGSIAGIADAVLPGVVTLHVSGRSAQGTGTGFVLDRRGHILTNHHVVAPAGEGGEIRVTFHGGESVPAEIVGMDSSYDLAVVKVTGVSGLRPLELGNSDSVRVGDPVVAIGAPFDLAGTVTAGIISAKERPITAGGADSGTDVSYVNALQTDAPINPGNSGGPLVDAQGRVIGVNSAMRGPDSAGQPDGSKPGSIGLGFAIPVNQAKRVAEELINTGRATHPVIGVRLDSAYTGEGARIGNPGGDEPAVTPGGPSDRAGIQEGDVITKVGETRVLNAEELIVKIRSHRPGDRLTLTVERNGQERTVQLTLGSSSGS